MAKVTLKCNSCSVKTSWPCPDEWKLVEGHERNMGQENHYQAIINGQCDCGNEMSVTFDCWEYPTGAVNLSEINVEGCSIIDSGCDECPNLHPND